MSTIDGQISELDEILNDIPKNGPLPDDIDDTIADCFEMIEQLKISVHSIKVKTQKDGVLTKIKFFQAELDKLKRRKLMGNNTSEQTEHNTEDDRHRANMDRLHIARQQLYDSEATVAETIDHLDNQEETLRRANANLKETNAELATSNKLLTRMSKWWRG